MEYVKKHKFTMFVILIYIVVIVFGYFVYQEFFGNNGEPVYGDRLDGIEKVAITNDQIKKIKDYINSNDDKVVSVDQIKVTGKTVNIIITFADYVTLKDAKAVGSDILKTTHLTSEQLAFYDFQVFLNKEINCYLTAEGKTNGEGLFTTDAVVSFVNDPSKNSNITSYGISNKKTKDYNTQKTYTATKNGDYTIYGFIKDKFGKEYSCSIKLTRKDSKEESKASEIFGTKIENFPIIGYRKAGAKSFSWTKDR